MQEVISGDNGMFIHENGSLAENFTQNGERNYETYNQPYHD